MRTTPDRTSLLVMPQSGVWRVEHDGREFGHSSDKQVALAAANRHAREMTDAGQLCVVRVYGEHGFWTVGA